LIRGGGSGTRRDAHGQKWFWFLLPKQKGLVGGGETPLLKIQFCLKEEKAEIKQHEGRIFPQLMPID